MDCRALLDSSDPSQLMNRYLGAWKSEILREHTFCIFPAISLFFSFHDGSKRLKYLSDIKEGINYSMCWPAIQIALPPCRTL